MAKKRTVAEVESDIKIVRRERGQVMRDSDRGKACTKALAKLEAERLNACIAEDRVTVARQRVQETFDAHRAACDGGDVSLIDSTREEWNAAGSALDKAAK